MVVPVSEPTKTIYSASSLVILFRIEVFIFFLLTSIEKPENIKYNSAKHDNNNTIAQIITPFPVCKIKP